MLYFFRKLSTEIRIKPRKLQILISNPYLKHQVRRRKSVGSSLSLSQALKWEF